MKRIIIEELISRNVRSRSCANKLREEILTTSSDLIIDFINVTFISRSFTDELFVIKEEFNKHIELINMSDIVESMTFAVENSRINKRVRKVDNSEIKEFSDIDSLKDFLSKI